MHAWHLYKSAREYLPHIFSICCPPVPPMTGNNSFQGAGVAWRVELLPCKIFPDGSDMTDIATAQKCLQWCMWVELPVWFAPWRPC